MSPEVAILIGAGLATLGWIYTGRRSRTLAKKQHTINAILRTNFDEKFLRDRAKLAPHLKNGECPDDMIDGKDEDLRKCFRDILNHYEFMAAGIRSGDFDEKLVKDSERGTFIALFSCCEKYIYNLRNNRNRQTIYEHLEWLYDRWEESPPGRCARSIEWLMSRPFYGKSNRKKS